MKRIIPFALLLLLIGTISNGCAAIQYGAIAAGNGLYSNTPITFTENGIVFHVYQVGTFNFDSPDPSYGITVGQDGDGRITNIGNIYIYYDYQNRVTQIGSVYMIYNQFALTQVGGMQLVYDYQGNLINMIGSVNNYGNVYPAPYNSVYYTGNYVRYGYDPYYRRNVYHSPNVMVHVQPALPRGGGEYHATVNNYSNGGGEYHTASDNFPRGGGEYHATVNNVPTGDSGYHNTNPTPPQSSPSLGNTGTRNNFSGNSAPQSSPSFSNPGTRSNFSGNSAPQGSSSFSNMGTRDNFSGGGFAHASGRRG